MDETDKRLLQKLNVQLPPNEKLKPDADFDADSKNVTYLLNSVLLVVYYMQFVTILGFCILMKRFDKTNHHTAK